MSVLTPLLPTPCLERCCCPLSEPSSCLQVSSFQIWNLRHFLELFPEGQGQALEAQRKNVQPLFPIVPGQLLCGAPNPADSLPSSPFLAWPRSVPAAATALTAYQEEGLLHSFFSFPSDADQD